MAKQQDSEIQEVQEAQPVVSFDPPKKNISFEQFVVMRGIKSHHVGGFKAYVADPSYSRPYEEWDFILRTYGA